MKILIPIACLLAAVFAEPMLTNIGYPETAAETAALKKNNNAYRHDLSIELKKRIRNKGVAFTRSSTISDEYRPSSSKLNPRQAYGVKKSNQQYETPSSKTAGLNQRYGVPTVNNAPPNKEYLPSSRSSAPNQDYGLPGVKSTPIREYGVPRNAPPSQEYGSPSTRNNIRQEYSAPSARNSIPNSDYGVPASRNAIPEQHGLLASRNVPLSQEYSPNSRTAPNQEYGAPASRNSIPKQEYGAPASRNSIPNQVYGAPVSRKTISNKVYGPPASRNSNPNQEYGHPASRNSNTNQEYGHTASSNSIPYQEYGAPASRNSIPNGVYGPPASRSSILNQEYGPPTAKYAIPSQDYSPSSRSNAPNVQYGPPSTRNSPPSQEYGASSLRNADLNQEYGLPAKTSIPNNEYGVPNNRNVDLNQKYGLGTNAELNGKFAAPIVINTLNEDYRVPAAGTVGINQDYSVPAAKTAFPNNEYGTPVLKNTNKSQFSSLSQDYGAPTPKSKAKSVTQEYSYLTGIAEENNSEIQKYGAYRTPNQFPSEYENYSKSLKGNSYNPSNGYGTDLKTQALARNFHSSVKSKNISYKSKSVNKGILEDDSYAPNYKVSNSKANLSWGGNQAGSNDKGYSYTKLSEKETEADTYEEPKLKSIPNFGPSSGNDFGGVGSHEEGYVYAKNSLDELRQEPANYNFAYQVNDDVSGSNFGHTESRLNDKAEGTYYVVLPDGNKQVVEYEADEGGFKPKISVERIGSAVGYDENAADHIARQEDSVFT